ncbi:APC family permease [Halococcus qingdaonensis]|uniref:APC family permease n=1 Tax=Halococcus qingdaonensis TaxID=224402 RepID=UPI002115F5B8|nr:APC family permease [Halococcus qingdaonensis]
MVSENAKIGFVGGVAIAIGSSVGGGLWATPVIAGAMGGPITVLIMLLVAVPTFLALPTYLTLTKAWPKTAGSYYYTTRMLLPERKNLSKLVGFTISFSGLMLGGLIYLRYMLLGGASFLNAIVPTISTELFTVLLLTISFAVVWFGIRATGVAEIVLDAVLLLSIGVIVGGGLLNVEMANLTPVMPEGFIGALPAYAVLLTLGGGAIKIINFGEEIEDVENTIGGIIVTSAIVDILVSVVVLFVAVGVVSYAQLEGQTLGFVVGQYLSGNLVVVTGIGALVAGFTTNIASVAVFTRIFSVLVDDNVFPEWVGRENEHGEPVYFLLVLYVLSVALTFVDVSFGTLAASFSFLFVVPLMIHSIVGVRLPSTFPDIFDAESVASTRWLRPRVVRWSALGLFVILAIMTVFLVVTQPQAFVAYLGLVAVSVLVFGLRWWQVGDSSRLMSSGVGFRTVQSDGGEQLNRSD